MGARLPAWAHPGGQPRLRALRGGSNLLLFLFILADVGWRAKGLGPGRHRGAGERAAGRDRDQHCGVRCRGVVTGVGLRDDVHDQAVADAGGPGMSAGFEHEGRGLAAALDEGDVSRQGHGLRDLTRVIERDDHAVTVHGRGESGALWHVEHDAAVASVVACADCGALGVCGGGSLCNDGGGKGQEDGDTRHGTDTPGTRVRHFASSVVAVRARSGCMAARTGAAFASFMRSSTWISTGWSSSLKMAAASRGRIAS